MLLAATLSSDLHTWRFGTSVPCSLLYQTDTGAECLATAPNDLFLREVASTDSRGTTSDADADSSEAAATDLVRDQILKSHLAEFIALTTQEITEPKKTVPKLEAQTLDLHIRLEAATTGSSKGGKGHKGPRCAISKTLSVTSAAPITCRFSLWGS